MKRAGDIPPETLAEMTAGMAVYVIHVHQTYEAEVVVVAENSGKAEEAVKRVVRGKTLLPALFDWGRYEYGNSVEMVEARGIVTIPEDDALVVERGPLSDA